MVPGPRRRPGRPPEGHGRPRQDDLPARQAGRDRPGGASEVLEELNDPGAGSRVPGAGSRVPGAGCREPGYDRVPGSGSGARGY
ncbi:MAG: hypothetical protein FJ149_08085 [Euryarchaeota archaeon]|nr:hypothetical protein [Euryarchaeota archaeon]